MQASLDSVDFDPWTNTGAPKFDTKKQGNVLKQFFLRTKTLQFMRFLCQHPMYIVYSKLLKPWPWTDSGAPGGIKSLTLKYVNEEMFTHFLLNNYNATVCQITTQETSDSADSKLFKL